MIEHFKIEAKGEPPTVEAFEEFMVKKYFRRNGRDLERQFSLGRDYRESILMKVNYQPDQGAFVSIHLFEFQRKGIMIEQGGRETRVFKEIDDLIFKLKDASMLLRDAVKDITKFIKG
jgi:hypothetical protein